MHAGCTMLLLLFLFFETREGKKNCSRTPLTSPSCSFVLINVLFLLFLNNELFEMDIFFFFLWKNLEPEISLNYLTGNLHFIHQPILICKYQFVKICENF